MVGCTQNEQFFDATYNSRYAVYQAGNTTIQVDIDAISMTKLTKPAIIQRGELMIPVYDINENEGYWFEYGRGMSYDAEEKTLTIYISDVSSPSS